jgi:hypothetical protein
MSTLKDLDVEFATDSSYLSGPTVGDANKIVPAPGDRQQGLVPGAKFPTQAVNHVLNAHGTYLKWLEGYAGACVPPVPVATKIYGVAYSRNVYQLGRFYFTQKDGNLYGTIGGSAYYDVIAASLPADMCAIAANDSGRLVLLPDNNSGNGCYFQLPGGATNFAMGTGSRYPKLLCDVGRNYFWGFGFDGTNAKLARSVNGGATWTYPTFPAPPTGTLADVRNRWISTPDYRLIQFGCYAGFILGWDNTNFGHILKCTDGTNFTYQAISGVTPIVPNSTIKYSRPIYCEERALWYFVQTGIPSTGTIKSIVYSSNTNGSSWTAVSSHEQTFLDLELIGSVLYALVIDGAVGRAVIFSLNGGLTWRQSSFGVTNLGATADFNYLVGGGLEVTRDYDDLLILACNSAGPITNICRLMPQGAAKTVP